MRNLISEYGKKRYRLKRRLKEFRSVWKRSDKKIFSELCFCICTPQSNAVYCDRAVQGLERNGDLFNGNISKIRSGLKAVRFPNNKSRYIIETRKLFTEDGCIKIKKNINLKNIHDTRMWFAENVKGLGLKEASHFLRNIGFGGDLAILDVHVLRNMKKYRVIGEIPENISKNVYLSIEDRLRRFSRKINISMEELDLLFWSSETGKIFK